MSARRRRTRAGITALIAAAAALTLAACGSVETTPGWAPRPAAAAAVALSDTLATAADAVASGLDVRLLYNADPASGVAARWAEIPGDSPLTAELRGRVSAAIAAQAAATGVPYRPAADAPALSPEARGCVQGSTTRPAAELLADPAFTPPGGGPTVTVACEVLAASGPLLVESLRILTATGGQVASDVTTTYYAETSGGFLITSDQLITDDGRRALLTDIVESLKVAAGAIEPRMKTDPAGFTPEQLAAWFSRAAFTADGSLVVTVPDGLTLPELDDLASVPRPSPLVVTVPAADATAMLTPEGAQVQAALASAAPLVLPPAPFRGQEQVDCSFFACMALTFDDGPGPYTAQVLDDLDARRAAATFFLQGVNVGRYPEAVTRMDDEGHQVGNHTWNHPDLTKLTDPEIKDQLDRTSSAIRSTVGHAPTTFRPPYGAYDDRVLAQTSLPAILWSIDTNDWQLPDDATLLDQAVTAARPGSIVLCHDVHENTARMVPPIVDGLQGRGFTLVTVQQLLGGTPAAHTTTTRG
ncbi:hypothetical protein GCM10010988_30920 [Cnuibacter physcomitrellae]|uniref:Uncharacterized protein n=1 Tax=Cnuibacter physcomitrellae TaxID=1619308 RepID=A0A1X9LJ55_9MICO|nr:polysaccharide deacetylase family protein [Cnuibacter physcomitrellae]ARJ04338.1 hypothetical protein B5808_03160 [Cnuibacter physcomitrellae]GGI40804.1 hypothetical protein GCM10010988_30920 [Cnuibacter physcomitrellae]